MEASQPQKDCRIYFVKNFDSDSQFGSTIADDHGDHGYESAIFNEIALAGVFIAK